MARGLRLLRVLAEAVAAAMMALIFLTFLIQIIVRYTASHAWLSRATNGMLDATHFGWTIEFILVLWLWTIFWGNAFVVKDRDHVTFDIIYNMAGRKTRTFLTVVGALIIVVALWSSIGPTYGRMKLLWIKSSATLPIKLMPIYSIYFVFLVAVGLRYVWRAWTCVRHGADPEPLGVVHEDPIPEEHDT